MTKNEQKNIETGLEIAIIGMAGKFPGAGTLDQFWENLKNGVEAISFFTCEELKEYGVSETLLNNPDYVKASGVLNGKEYFDSSFFGFSPKEAESMDPQIRLFLESSWETLEDAGYDSTSYKGAVGIYAGIADGFSWRAARMLKDLRDGVEQTVHLLDTSLLLSTRVSHKLDLKGPSITLYTACSTSLVAVHQACRSLLTGECDMALAGAVSVQPIDKSGYLYQEGMILSPDGHNRSFDAQAKGTIFSEGIGIILLKRLKDALADGDAIKSVIKASAVNNDGIGKSSFTAPGKKRIADVIRTALKLSRWSPGHIGYIEAHGAATALGDAIEVEALKEALNFNKKAYCAIGSVKSNIGHLDVASGMAGLIKTVQAIQRRLIPPSLYFETPNPKIDFIDSPFYINAALTPWENLENPLRAGICSFGIGGSNAFIFLEEPPVRAELETAAAASTVPRLFLLSARTDSALGTMTRNLAEYFKNNPGVNLADAAYTLQVGRKTFSRRRMFICSNTAEAVEALINGVDPFAEDASAPVELLRKAGVAWLEKGTIEGQQKGRRISLPTYPFERQRYWIDGIGGNPLSALSSPREKGDTGPSPAKIEKTVEKEAPGLYQRPQLSTVYEPPADEIEQALTGIWQRFFGIREVGVLDDFFELGGDSLKVITVVTEIHKQMDARVSIPQVFDTPTIRGLAGYIKSKGAGVDKYTAIEPVEKKEYYPLSSAQMRIYILQQLEIHGTGYNTPLLFIWEGRIDRRRMENVFQSLVARHESLRTSFELIDGEVVQRIHREVEFKIEYYDLATDEHGQTRTLLKVLGSPETLFQKGFWPPEAIIKSFIRPFDVSCAPLLRVGLAEIDNDSYLFMVDMHHSITDGSSIGVLIREFASLYTGETLPELRIQYKDYTHWQNSDKQKEVVKTQESYWLGVFEGELPVLNLPLDYVRPALQSFEGNRTRFEISREEAGALRSLALKEDATLFMVLLSLYNILLAKICGQEDIVIGTPIAGRSHADLQRIIGMLVNTLALRNAPMGEKTSREFLQEVRKNTLAAFENQDYPFEDLVERATRQINRDISRNPVFDTIFNLLNFESQYENNVKIEVPGMTLRPYEYERGIAIFDLSLEAEESQDGITFTFEFCTKLFKPGTIDRFIGYFKKILTAAAAPDQKIARLEIISEEEKQRILHDCTGPVEEFEGELLIHYLFQRQVEKTPDHIALVGADLRVCPVTLSYKKLNEQSNRLAGVLAEKGVLPDNIVAIKIERSIEMIIGIIGILKAGGAYLPIDPQLPQERIDYMLKDSGAKLLAVANDQESEKGRRWEGEKVHLEEISKLSKISSYPLTFLPSYLLSSSNLIYIIYTSGSTGRPKGVMLEHRNARNLLLYQYRYTPIDFSRVLQFTTISFDVSFQEIFSTLLAGGMLVLADIEIIRDFPRLFEVIEQNILKTLFLPASFLKFVFNQEEYAAIFPSCVEHIVTAGEQPIVTDSFRKYLKDHGVYFHNHYGPTETHVVTALTIAPASEIPALPSIGKPLANTQIYIVDNGFHLLPVGIAGELLIGGVQVGRGYLNNPELTAERFNRSYRSNKTYINYKTGDLARWLPAGPPAGGGSGGVIEFLGRIDFQVKIRGYRVELGEIESKLMAADHVKEAVVIAGKDPKGEMYLCAYIVPVNPEQANKETLAGLRKILAGALPDYMTPSHFMFLDKIPLTASGKVNRKALPEPLIGTGGDYFALEGPVETGLAEIWSQVLDIEKRVIGFDANFFELGGHSLKAAVLTAKIHKYFYIEMPLGDIFKHPTLSGMAEYIRQAEEEIFASIPPVEERDYYPLSSAQKRLYIIQQLDPGSSAYNMPSAMIIEEGIDKQRLENTFRQLIRRHESFRTSFATTNEEPVQRVHKDVEFEIEYYDPAADEHGQTRTVLNIIKNFIRPFDLSRAPLLRVGVGKVEEGKHLLMVDMHHIISDGISIRILTREFIRFYLGETLVKLPVQYKDFTCWQQRALVKQKTAAQEYYWIKRFSGDIPTLTLPIDYPRPAVQGFEGSNYIFEMEEKETAALNHLARQHEATLFMVLIAVFNVLLARLSGQEDIITGTPIAGRRHTDLEPLIGMFVNTLALRHFPAGELTFASFFEEVRTRTLKDFENQDCQFEDVVEKVVVRRDAGRSPLFDVMFALQNIEELKPGDVPNELELRAYGYDFERKVSRFDMTWNIIEKNGRLVVNIEYSTLLFKKDTIARFSNCFKKIAAAIIAFPDLRISQVDIIPEEERRRILDEFNAVWTDYPGHKTIQQLFEEQVEKMSDAVGLVGQVGPVGLSYKKLNEQSDRLAGLLIEKGVEPGHIVGIMGERSINTIIGLLGILKAGGAYLPIDPDYPQKRIDYMLKDSAAKLLAVANDQEGEKVRRWEGEKVHLEEISKLSKISSYPLTFLPSYLLSSSNLIYIIYTSGSTGKPKGVMVEHRNVVRLVKNTNYITFNTGDRLLQTGALEFDASTFEIWGALLNGLTLYLAGKQEILKADSLKSIIRTYDIGIMWMTSPLFDHMVEEDIEVFSGLRYFLVGGDVLSTFHIGRLRNRYPRLNVINGYGPTENTTFSTTLPIDGEYAGSIPIGRPIANSSAYILDNYGMLCPIGVVGELYVGGDGVARGYLNNPELTAEKFVKNRSYRTYKTYIFYKTGDLARWLPAGPPAGGGSGGVIEFLGRIDYQVKISGYRVEPGEVRQQLLRHPQIREAVVAVRETQTADKYLCAYIVLRDSYISDSTQSTNPAELREFLLRILPDYMVPAHFITIEKIPLTANGKVDTKALPEPGKTGKPAAVEESVDEIEECVLDTWSQVLALEKNKIGRHDDFFQLGGHSLKAAVSIARIHKELNVEVPLVEIFKTPTAAGLAEYIRKHLNSREKYTSIEPTEKKEYYNLSPAQKRMYLLHLMEPGSTVYNIPQFFGLDMEFRRDKLEQIFRQLIQRHESFRTSFITVDEEPVQRVHQDVEFEIEYSKVLGSPETLFQKGFWPPEAIIKSFIRPFDLTRAPLLRVGVASTGAGTLLMVDMHHIVSDGVSMDILVREFLGLSRGEVLPGLRLQYKDYAQWQNSDIVKRKTKFQGKYWLREFSGGAPILELPTDFVRPEVRSFEGGSYYFELGKEEGAALNHLAHQQGATLYIVLLTMFDILLFKLSGQEDIVVGTPTAGRGHADLEAIIGMFVNTLALRNFPGPGKTITEFLQEVKTNTLRAFENQDFPFEDLVEKAVVKRDSSRGPLFDVMFTLQNFGNAANIGIRDSSSEPGLNAGKKVSRFDMTWAVTEKENRLVFEVEYCARLFKEETIKRFGAYFKKIVGAITDGPIARIGDIEIILDEERQRLLYEFNTVVSEGLYDKTILELIEEQTERTPDRISLVNTKTTHELHEISYRELNEKSNYLAYVLREKGVLADTIAALKIERSVEMIIGVLGILKAGGAYLPIEPEYPAERIDYMLKDSGARLLVTTRDKEGEKVRRREGKIVLLEEIFHSPKSFSYPLTFLPSYLLSPSNLAYIIYTSGTTGKPKGVLVEHRNLTAYVRAFLQEFKPGPGDIAILEASFVFDAFVEEVYPILLAGGRLCIARKQEVMDGHLLEAFIIKNNITIISCSPLLLNEINRFSNLNNLPAHTFISGADVLKKEYIGGLLGNRTIYNVYGPTETTVCASYYRLPGKMASIGVNIPIGKPITGYRVYILDEEYRLPPIGAPGEICIAGNGVTRGYLNNPGLTAEKFIKNRSYRTDKTYVFYKTGDLGRWLPDPAVPGSYVIEFLGRIDRQVKIRGFRIELGEIESQLLQHAAVKEAAVIDREDANKDKYLCAYIIPVNSNTWNPTGLKEFLSGRLPAYMIPANFVCIDRFPLTSGGKLDRGALPLPKAGQAPALSDRGAAETRTGKEIDGIETKLTALWAEVLGMDRRAIGRETNFFEVGGHSLKATVLTGKIHKLLGVRVPLVEIFRTPTVKGLAGYIRGAKEEAFLAVEPAEEREYYPLSSAQRRLYVLQQMDPGSAVYNMPSALMTEGEIDIQKLHNTFYQLIRRHESFRTSFVTVDEEPVQRVHRDVEFEIEYYDPATDEHGQTRTVLDIIKNFIRPFELTHAPLLRVELSQLEEGKHLLVVDMHHIISDGISIRTLMREFVELYRGKTLSRLRLQYKDYAAWQNSSAGKWKAKDQQKYWLNEFSEEVAVLTLPMDFARPAVRSFEGSNYHFELGAGETAALNRLALEQGGTLFMVLTSIFNVMLSKLSGQEDVVIGTPIAGRKHADLQHIIGIFVNTLALRNFPVGNKTFSGFLQEVGARTLKAFENQDCQFEELVDRLSLKREADRNPLFDVMFALQNFGEQKLEKKSAETGLNVYDYEFENKVSRFDMSWNTNEWSNRLDFAIEYSTRLFKRETIERFTTYFKKIIETVIAEPGAKIAVIEIMPEDERRRILFEFNNTAAEYPRDKTIHQLFEEQAEKSPDHIALVGTALTVGLSYRQLNDRSDRLAMRLIDKGVEPGDIVGIMMERSIDMIIGLLGILKSGGAYLPIDSAYPRERIDYMLKDSGAKILLTDYEKKIIVNCQLLIVNCKLLIGPPQASFHHSSFIIHHSNLSYIIYTSGTTGKPKGVMAEHRGVARLVKNTNYLIFNQKDRILPTGALEFDISTFETWGPLLNGLSMYLAAKEVVLDAGTLGNALTKYDIAILHLIPQLFNRAVDRDPAIFKGLDYLLVGGDRVNREAVEIVRNSCPGIKILHMYGPTENTTFSSFLPVERNYEAGLPIGGPIANGTVYISDKYGLLCPMGVVGELYVGGDGVARGYLNRPELTAEKFNRSYMSYKTYIFYKTGDLARWLPAGPPAGGGSGGVIEFLGRIDHQVKVRGIRVELGEIENCLTKHNLVKEAVVIDRKDDKGETYLCAYIVPGGEGVAGDELREYLTAVLPRNMIPAYFIPLEKIPVTAVGKIDRRALPGPMFEMSVEHSGPVDKVEECLVETWSHVLSLEKEKIDRHANFFALGGHSLKATVVIAKIHKDLGVKVPLAEVFKTPTVEGLAGYIRGAKEEAFFAVEAVEEREYYPLSSAQRRLYVLQQMDLDSMVYNMPLIVSLDTAIDKDRLWRVTRQLVQRHESFRTSFQTVNQEPVQRVHRDIDFEIGESGGRGQGSGISDFVRPFDLSRAPLLRVGTIKVDENKCILAADMHHIISDGVSMDILIREFLALYEDERLPALRIQYKDYTLWQTGETVKEKIKDQEEFWLKELSGDIPILDLPFDYPRPQVQSFEGDFFNFFLSREETGLLKKVVLEQGVTMFLLVATLFEILLYKLSGQEDIVIGTPIAGRRHADLQGIIGMFVNTLVLRNFPSGNKTFVEFLEEVKTRTLRAFENQDYQFEDLVEKVAVGRDPGRNPLFDVMLTWQEMTNKREDSAPHMYEGRVARFDMTWFASEKNDCFSLGIEYCTRLFKLETIKRFTTYFKKIVAHVIAAPGAAIAEIDIVSEEEKHRLLYDFNRRETEYPGDKTIPQLFEEQVQKSPDHIAVFCHGRTRTNTDNNVGADLRVCPVSLSYRQLNDRSDQSAMILLKKGIRPGDIVGIMIERSNEMIIGLLGILKSGCAYLPINPGFPRERIDYMLKDSSAKVLLTATGCVFNFHHSSFIIHHSNLAYIIYTSGSTGKPKGVPITHANLSPLLHWGYRHLGINEKDRTIQNLSYYFDWSVWEIFITLTTGAGLFMITEELLLNPGKSVAFIRRHAITVLHVTPTQFRYYLAAGQNLETLRYLFIGAESLGLDLVKRSFQSVNDDCRVFNMYGPTEATIIASVLEIGRSGLKEYRGLSTIPIGSPVGNTEFLILDKNNRVCPINVTGELYIGGGGLARGYLNNPELTAEKFIKNRSYRTYKTYILYKTGDLARWLPAGPPAGGGSGGVIEFLGRSDFQVKIRGYRIELGEIENRLAEHPSVREAAVLALDISSTGKDNVEKYLCAYIVPGSHGILNTLELKEFLSRSLPDYMIPSHFVSIDHIPLNPNGKVDRRALPAPGIEAGDRYEAPSSEIEKKLVDIWSEILGLDKGIIGIHDDFFERGGHSLKAAILVSRIQKEFCINMPLVEVFKTPTVKGLGKYLNGNLNKGESGVPAVEDENLVLLRGNAPGRRDALPLFFIHGGSGEAEGYIELCGRLNDRYNCWGLRVDRVDRVDRSNHFVPRDLGIPELAAKYIKAIKKVQPHGPYFIVGWCIGGTIAFEMTRQLERNGEKPGTLCLVNAYAPFNKHKGKTRTFNIASELSFLKLLKISPTDRQLKKKLENAADIRQIWQQVVDHCEQRNITVEMLKTAVPKNIADAIPVSQAVSTPDRPRQGLREFIYYINITRSLELAREIYNPPRNGAITSKSKADVYFFGATRSGIPNKNRWPDYFEKPVKYHEVEGDHFSIFKIPDVVAFAEQFNRVL